MTKNKRKRKRRKAPTFSIKRKRKQAPTFWTKEKRTRKRKQAPVLISPRKKRKKLKASSVRTVTVAPRGRKLKTDEMSWFLYLQIFFAGALYLQLIYDIFILETI